MAGERSSLDRAGPTRFRMSAWAACVILAWTVVLGATGCGPSASAYTSVLRLPLYGATAHDPGILDPAQATPSTPLSYVSLTQIGLVKLSPDLHVLPELAVSLPTISPSGRAYTFTLRQDARFADGTPCTAADVAYSLERSLRFGSSLARQYLGGIVGASRVEAGATWNLSGVSVLHRLTVRIRLRRSDVSFLTKLAFPVAAVVEPESKPGTPHGLGPFAPAVRERDGQWLLRARLHYFGGPPAIHEVRLIPVSSEKRGIALYHSGGIDVARVPFDTFATSRQSPEFYMSSSLDAFYAVPEHPSPRLTSLLDRDSLARVVGPSVQPLDTLVPPAVPDYQGASPLVSTPVIPQIPAVAIVSSDHRDAEMQAVQAALLQQWRQTPGGAHIGLKHVWFLLPDPERWLTISPDAVRSDWYGSVLRQGERLTFDLVGRMGIYAAAETWSLNRGAAIPLASGEIGFLVRPLVDGMDVTPEGLMPANDDWTQVALNSSR